MPRLATLVSILDLAVSEDSDRMAWIMPRRMLKECRSILHINVTSHPIVERVIGSIRRECLDHVTPMGESHPRRVLNEYVAYHNGSRAHRSLGGNAPEPRPVGRARGFWGGRPCPTALNVTWLVRLGAMTSE